MVYYKKKDSIEICDIRDECVLIYDSESGNSYEIGKVESSVLNMLDGAHTIYDIEKQGTGLRHNELSLLIREFQQLSFLESAKKHKHKRIKVLHSSHKLKISFFNPNHVFPSNNRFVSFSSNINLFISIPVFLIGILTFLFSGQLYEIMSRIQIELYLHNWTVWLSLYLFINISAFFHELSHALVARKYGVSVVEMGIMFYLFLPFAYTNINGMHNGIGKKRQIAILSAGVFSDLFLTGICLMLMLLSNNNTVLLFLFMATVANLISIVLNSLVFIKFDGYYILQVLLSESSLKEKNIAFMVSSLRKRQIKAALLGTVSSEDAYSDLLFAFVYGCLSFVFIPIFIIGSIVGIFI